MPNVIIDSICDTCAGANDREGLTAWQVPTTMVTDIAKAMLAESPVDALVSSGVMTVDDNRELVFGKKYQHIVRGRMVEANKGNNGTFASSAQTCLYPAIDFADKTYTRAAHTNAISVSVEKCLNELRMTEEWRNYADTEGVINPSRFYGAMRDEIIPHVQSQIGTSILFGQRGNSVTQDAGGSLFDGVFKKAKVAAANSYYHTLSFDLSGGEYTLFGFGSPKQLTTLQLVEFLSTAQLAGGGLSGLAYSVLLDGTTLIVMSNITDVPINGAFRILSDYVTDDCDTSKLIVPTIVQSYMPIDAAPLITNWEAITVANAATKLYEFVQKVVNYSIANGKGWGTAKKKLVIFYDPYFDLQNDFRKAIRECCATPMGQTFEEFLTKYNISFLPLNALMGTSIFFASTLGNLRFNRASGLDTMGFRNTCDETWRMYYGTFAGLSVINTGDIALSVGGNPLYENMTTTTIDEAEANLATCPAVQSNCVTPANVGGAFRASATGEVIVCNSEKYVSITDTTVYPNTRTGAVINVGYIDAGGAAHTATVTLGAMEYNGVAILAATDTVTLVELIATDGTLGAAATFLPAHALELGDCDDLSLACLTHKPSGGDGSGDETAMVAVYAIQGVVHATWVAYDSVANAATYTIQYVGAVLPTALSLSGEAIIAGACV